MNWRRLPLPLLLLTVTLSPVDARGLSSAGAFPQGRLDPQTRQTAPSTAVRGVRKRREEQRSRVGEQELARVREYLAAGAAASAEAARTWDAFYARSDDAIRSFASARGLRGADLEDCAQEVWTDLLRILPTFELDAERGRFDTWLYTLVRNKAADLRRREARNPVTDLDAVVEQSDDDSGPHRIEREEKLQALYSALATLKAQSSATSYRVLHLRQLEGWDVGRVAAELSLTPAQVWAREHRMKRKLLGILSQRGINAPAAWAA